MSEPISEQLTSLHSTKDSDRIIAVAVANNGFTFENFEYKDGVFVGEVSVGSGRSTMSAMAIVDIPDDREHPFVFDHISLSDRHPQKFTKTDPR